MTRPTVVMIAILGTLTALTAIAVAMAYTKMGAP